MRRPEGFDAQVDFDPAAPGRWVSVDGIPTWAPYDQTQLAARLERGQHSFIYRPNVAHRRADVRVPRSQRAWFKAASVLAAVLGGLLIVALGAGVILVAMGTLGWLVEHPPLPFVVGAALVGLAAWMGAAQARRGREGGR